MKTHDWQFEPEYNAITAIEPGNNRIRIVHRIFGVTEEDWLQNGSLMALAQRLARFAELVMATATIETPHEVVKEGRSIISKLEEIKQTGDQA